MIVIKKDPEKKLHNSLRSLKGQLPAYRCAVLRFSTIDAAFLPEDWFETLLRAVLDILYDEDTQVYLCSNNDVFIVSRVISHKFTNSLISHPLLLPWPVSLNGELATLFEVGFEPRDLVESFFKNKDKEVEGKEYASRNG